MKLSEKTLRILKGEEPIPFYMYSLAPAAVLYSFLGMLKAELYRNKVLPSRRLPCTVISVGNISSGGTGKTPFVLFLADYLTKKGLKPVILTRGYRGRLEGRIAVVSDGSKVWLSTGDSGDEAAMLARGLPGVPVVMGADRYNAGLAAWETFCPDVFILDDGYQHLALQRDLNILLLDAERPFGNGYTIPLGYLRERKKARTRADLAVLTRSGTEAAELKSLFPPSVPVIRTLHRPSKLFEFATGREVSAGTISGKGVLALSSVAGPGSFSLLLKELNANILKQLSYPDHHGYRPQDFARIEGAAKVAGADFIVTTEKDAVKLGGFRPAGVKVLVLGIRIEVIEGFEIFERMMMEICW